MNDDLLNIGRPQAVLSAAGTYILKYTVEMYHEGLKEHKLVSAKEEDVLENKVSLQISKWNEKWEKGRI